ncbi:MAG TPA: sigma-54 dependent transcriptional regulator [Gemmatimonadales bacterium]|nr:sigma-54 dependent transcriptional regulator [Gemmatimonadales bacterium]
MPEHLLIVEDDHALLDLLTDIVREAKYEAHPFSSVEAARRALDAGLEVDLAITDLVLPGQQGSELLAHLRATRPHVNVIVITAFGSIESAIELVRAGAFDYLTKPIGTEELLHAIERALVESRARRSPTAPAAVPPPLPGFVGRSPAMQEVFRLLERAARSAHPVLITGESGTGKELVARAVHQLSGRGTFVPVNCGALPEHLLESELFGHERGAFTGADRARDGLFQVANGGTLFLDEIGELPVSLQPKLLRALESGEVRRVGATRTVSADVRVVAATNRDLEADMRAGRFRQDLFWRLNVLTVHLPPLRERLEDLPELAAYLLSRALHEGRLAASDDDTEPAPLRFAPEVVEAFRAYTWPGNVRELRNVIARAATLATGEVITLDDLPPRLREAPGLEMQVAAAARQGLTLRDVERAYILEVLRSVQGNRSRAAVLLGLDRKTLYRRLEEYRAEDPALDV